MPVAVNAHVERKMFMYLSYVIRWPRSDSRVKSCWAPKGTHAGETHGNPTASARHTPAAPLD